LRGEVSRPVLRAIVDDDDGCAAFLGGYQLTWEEPAQVRQRVMGDDREGESPLGIARLRQRPYA
jgi:hypothetical protein